MILLVSVIETDDIEEDDHYALVVESIKKCGKDISYEMVCTV